MAQSHHRRPGTRELANVLFLSIPDLAKQSPPAILQAMERLHGILGKHLLGRHNLPDVRVLSTLKGAAVVFPDSSPVEIIGLFAPVAEEIARAHIAVRGGLARGIVEWQPDSDEVPNCIGPAVNIGNSS